MTEHDERFEQLSRKMDQLLLKQSYLDRELSEVRTQLNNYRTAAVPPTSHPMGDAEPIAQVKQPQPAVYFTPAAPVEPVKKRVTDWEKFLGENLINKVGIAITILGVAIGARYAISHNLISPLMRILSGYGFALALAALALKLKKNYHNYSAVLLSGSLTMLYFLTYFAYSAYSIIPQLPAFILMVLFTAITVYAALRYNQQVIALIGMTGAYLVPVLLSTGQGNVSILFTYMTIINCGILYIIFRRNWQLLLYGAFIASWLIFLLWFLTKYQPKPHQLTALVFSLLFFAVFQVSMLANRVLARQKLGHGQIGLLVVNSFLSFAIGYAVLDAYPQTAMYLGLFALGVATLHLAAGVIIYSRRLAEEELFFLVCGLALVFLTLAIPLQFDGKWVTLMWSAEFLLLFAIGRSRNSPVYATLSYPLLVIAVASLWMGWVFSSNDTSPAFFNLQFVTELAAIACFGGAWYVCNRFPADLSHQLRQAQSPSSAAGESKMRNIDTAIPFVFTIQLFVLIFLEIGDVFTGAVALSEHLTEFTRSVFGLVFMTIATVILTRNKQSVNYLVPVNSLALLYFLFAGLYSLGQFREMYTAAVPQVHPALMLLRYPAIALAGILLWLTNTYLTKNTTTPGTSNFFQLFLHLVVVWILGSELLHWLDQAGIGGGKKLGLSILWGTYSLAIIVYGIRRHQRQLRILGLALFGATLLKLFSYDLTNLSTVSKTILFVVLGVLLLIISFLYNKYKTYLDEDQG
ncbi:MAG: DUF2339 domain-containing protein [Bacteroidota bacterium]